MKVISRTSVLVALALVVAIGLLTSAVFALSASTQERSGDALLTSNRDQLRLCVEAIDVSGTATDNAAERIDQRFSEVAAHPRFDEWGYGRGGGVVIDLGCPGEAFLLQPGVTFRNGFPTGDPKPPIVPEASVYRLFVFVISQGVRDSIIQGDMDIRRYPQEAICENRTCRTVTTAIYLTEEEFEDEAFLTEWLIRGLELEPPKGYAPDNFKPGDPR